MVDRNAVAVRGCDGSLGRAPHIVMLFFGPVNFMSRRASLNVVVMNLHHQWRAVPVRTVGDWRRRPSMFRWCSIELSMALGGGEAVKYVSLSGLAR